MRPAIRNLKADAGIQVDLQEGGANRRAERPGSPRKCDNPETRNPKPETRNLKPKTRDPRPETRNPKPETRSPKPETRNPKP